MSDFIDPANAKPDSGTAIPASSAPIADNLIIPSADMSAPPPPSGGSMVTDPVVPPVAPPPPPEPVLPQLAVEPAPAPTGLPPETSSSMPPVPPPLEPNQDNKPQKKGVGKGLVMSLLLLLIMLPFGVYYMSKTGTGLFDTRNRAASAEPCKVCSSAKKCVTVASGSNCSSSYNECSTDASCGGTTTAPYCSSSKCPYGCTSNTTSGGNCKPAPATATSTTTAPYCSSSKCPYGCTSNTTSGGNCKPAPTDTPRPVTPSSGTCVDYTQCSCGRVCTIILRDSYNWSCPQYCGTPTPPPATTITPYRTPTISSTCPAIVTCNCPTGAKSVCNNVIRENPWFGNCDAWCKNITGTPTPPPPTPRVTCNCNSTLANYAACMKDCSGVTVPSGDKKCSIVNGIDSCTEYGMRCHCQDGNACTKSACEPDTQNYTSCKNQGRSWCVNQGGYAYTCCVEGYTCGSSNGCFKTGNTTTPRLTNPPTNPPVTGECLAIKAYKGATLLDATALSKLKPGDVITFAVKGSNNPSKAHFKINGAATWEESTTKNAGGEYTLNYTIPTDKTNFTIAAEVFVDNAWK